MNVKPNKQNQSLLRLISILSRNKILKNKVQYHQNSDKNHYNYTVFFTWTSDCWRHGEISLRETAAATTRSSPAFINQPNSKNPKLGSLDKSHSGHHSLHCFLSVIPESRPNIIPFSQENQQKLKNHQTFPFELDKKSNKTILDQKSNDTV